MPTIPKVKVVAEVLNPGVVLGWEFGNSNPVSLFVGSRPDARRFFEANKKSKKYYRIEWHNLGVNSRHSRRIK